MTPATETVPRPFDAAAAVAADFEVANRSRLEREAESRISPRHTNRASDLGDPCERRLYLKRVAWKQIPPPDAGLISILEEGNIHEPSVIQAIERLGWRILREQVPFHDRGLKISGRPEGFLDAYGVRLLIEITTVQPHAFDRYKTADDLRNGDHWRRLKFAQVQVYLLMTNTEAGVVFLKNKGTGEIRAVPIELDYAFTETLLGRAARVDAAAREFETLIQGTISGEDERIARDGCAPPFVEDRRLCKACPLLGAVCFPSMDFGPGAAVLTASDLLEAEKTYWDTREAAGRHDRAEKRLKDASRDTGRDLVIVGDSTITIERRKTTKYEIPPDVKAQFARPGEAIYPIIERAAGAGAGEE